MAGGRGKRILTDRVASVLLVQVGAGGEQRRRAEPNTGRRGSAWRDLDRGRDRLRRLRDHTFTCVGAQRAEPAKVDVPRDIALLLNQSFGSRGLQYTN
jgi:hypothetical protein